MATIYKYIKEAVHINDNPNMNTISKIYNIENNNIAENSFININRKTTVYVKPNVYSYCNNNYTLPKTSYFIAQNSSNIQTKNIKNIKKINGNINSVKTYNNIKTKQVCKINIFDYKNTLWASSNKYEFSLGLVVTTNDIEVTLTSTYNYAITIEEVSYSYGLGITAIFNEGYTIPPHGHLKVIFRVDPNIGKPIVNNDKIWFKFNNGLIIDWRWCFTRSSILYYFPFPDKNSYQESFSYFSKNFVSLMGSEDVIPFVDIPKKSFSANYSFLSNKELMALNSLALKNEYREIYFPIWSEKTSPLKNTTIPITIIPVNRVSEFIKEGSQIVVQDSNNPLNFKIVSVSAVDYINNTISIEMPITFKTTDYVIPLELVIPNNNMSNKYYNVKDQTISISVRTLK